MFEQVTQGHTIMYFYIVELLRSISKTTTMPPHETID